LKTVRSSCAVPLLELSAPLPYAERLSASDSSVTVL
jgi:hypothetical protein